MLVFLIVTRSISLSSDVPYAEDFQGGRYVVKFVFARVFLCSTDFAVLPSSEGGFRSCWECGTDRLVRDSRMDMEAG